jgi:hypothetical protein
MIQQQPRKAFVVTASFSNLSRLWGGQQIVASPSLHRVKRLVPFQFVDVQKSFIRRHRSPQAAAAAAAAAAACRYPPFAIDDNRQHKLRTTNRV